VNACSLWTAVLTTALGTTPVLAQSVDNEQPAILRPGDSLRVLLVRVPEVSGAFLVTSDSTLSHPVYQGIKVVGVPMSTVRQQIRSVLVPYQREPEFSIQPLLRVSVGGEVRLPRVYFFPPEVTIGAAVDYAGGASDRGNLDDVVLVRNGSQIRFSLTDPSGDAEFVTVRSGDRIIVSKRPNVWGWLGPVATITAIAASIVVIARDF
jgi:polysaccharide biosynthesis/export protein